MSCCCGSIACGSVAVSRSSEVLGEVNNNVLQLHSPSKFPVKSYQVKVKLRLLVYNVRRFDR